MTVAFMLELLNLEPGDRVLEIGAGSGWQAALIAHIVGKKTDAPGNEAQIRQFFRAGVTLKKKGAVIAIERLPYLQQMAERNIRKYGFVEEESVTVLYGDGSKGYVEGAPYDKIISAAAAPAIPVAWKEQLRVHGRIVAPVGTSILVLDKIARGEFDVREYRGFSFVPLVTQPDAGGG